jgi:ubiquinone biosynthesis protein COQ4
MTALQPRALPSFAQPRRRPRPQWRRAFRALRALLAEPERTEQAFEVIAALDPDLMERSLARSLSHPEGRRLFMQRPRLLDRLSDREALALLPEGSLGRAYLAHIERHGLDPGKLVALGRSYPEIRAEDEGARWFADRSELSHDLHHVLTGYGADGLGETALLWFSHGLSGGRGNALLMIGAALQSRRFTTRGWWRYLGRAWKRGRRAACLGAMPWEDLLALPLPEVRRLAGIEAPEQVHPEGVRVEPLQAPA